MIKLSNSDYRLPIVEAISEWGQFEAGTTLPHRIIGVDRASGERDEYVVKFWNHNRMNVSSSAFELLGAWMARELGLNAVEPALIHISKEFVDGVLKGRNGYKAASQSLGLNFGSKYREGESFIPPERGELKDEMLEQAKMLFVFDVFISNADRGHQKPNVSSNGTDLFVYDHELAFTFTRILPFARNKTPWLLGDTEKEIYANHYFYNALREKETEVTQEVDKLTCFDNSFWEKAFNLLPLEWITDEVKQIPEFLESIIENRVEFAESLNQTLSQ